jgi:probable rRNA maturation factor
MEKETSSAGGASRTAAAFDGSLAPALPFAMTMTDEPESKSVEIAVSIHDTAWLEALEDLESRAQAVVRAALKQFVPAHGPAGGGGPLEISLVFTDDAEQRALNRDYRQRDQATNVLSFPNMDDPGGTGGPAAADLPQLLGDVVLARETVAREAVEQGKSLQDHTAHLLVHGLLHLLGYDHEDSAEAEEMEALETGILAEMGIADPYGAVPDAAERPGPAAPASGGVTHG